MNNSIRNQEIKKWRFEDELDFKVGDWIKMVVLMFKIVNIGKGYIGG